MSYSHICSEMDKSNNSVLDFGRRESLFYCIQFFSVQNLVLLFRLASESEVFTTHSHVGMKLKKGKYSKD
jgi:hypothetical protein